LDERKKNPREKIPFYDENGKKWELTYIHYNNKFFKGTRDEYRLTPFNHFAEKNYLKAGDEVHFYKDDNSKYRIKIIKK